MATINLRTPGISPALKPDADRRLSSAKSLNGSSQSVHEFVNLNPQQQRVRKSVSSVAVKSMKIVGQSYEPVFSPNGPVSLSSDSSLRPPQISPDAQRKTKIVCTIGPSTSSREMIWKLAETGMNVARLNMSHGDHASHQETINLVKEYNAQFNEKVIAIMLDTKGPEVRSGDVPKPIFLQEGQEFNFTIKRGVSTNDTVSVNYDDFINDVDPGDILLVDGGMMSLGVKSKTKDVVKCEVIDGGELKSRRHLNVRGKSATLPSITDKDWEDIKFGVDNQVDFYAVSFVKNAEVVRELKDFLKSCNADIHVIVKIESADSIVNLPSILAASDGAMVARGDLGAELPIEEVPLLQEDIIRRCQNLQKPVIVATNMLESMIDHPTPTRAEVSDIAIAVRQGADAIMLSGETAHGKFPLKSVKVMHTVALRTESSSINMVPLARKSAKKSHMGEIFGYHAATIANTLNTPIIVFTRTGSMAVILSHYRPFSTIFAFTNVKRVQQRLMLYHGVMPIYMEFSDDAEETFSRALNIIVDKSLVKEGQYVTLVQSGAQPIWRQESTHHIQVRMVQG
ncbi:putative pyruvate kinase [Helianthus annuus]|uniref:Pyruvate kinase n=1 Tax=Helianthus annuus TaxID=4232 RepID=A0A251VBD1_HELAN|nr:pyruvate kinase isozyme G, chloroplastic [Helianthus annuus]KAF5816152.1 putative pyruvate kinase [Helianthus annuus]KAJ0602685.1 putative pyruvate kinase [Helianthus annuus]KAJ0937464.1 putative pyruvate kinase [Helianthus annuus]KAJ0945422.1 putative pyruvate kinase [Helianthus annuus]